jgi:hypothetical protein
MRVESSDLTVVYNIVNQPRYTDYEIAAGKVVFTKEFLGRAFYAAATRTTSSPFTSPMDQITMKTPNLKCRLFFKIGQYRNLAAGVYLSEAS